MWEIKNLSIKLNQSSHNWIQKSLDYILQIIPL